MSEVQNHIHLDMTLGGAPENAPLMKWKVRLDGWLPNYHVIEEHRRTLSGKLAKHRLRNTSNEIVKLIDYKYILRVDAYWGYSRQERLDALLDMQGNTVYLVDNRHPNDGLDHTTFVRSMYFPVISDIKIVNPQMSTMYIAIDLVDDSL